MLIRLKILIIIIIIIINIYHRQVQLGVPKYDPENCPLPKEIRSDHQLIHSSALHESM